jgi:hypothetical protein
MRYGTLPAKTALGLALVCPATKSTASRKACRALARRAATARFYADHILNKATGLRDSIVEGADSVTAMPLESF